MKLKARSGQIILICACDHLSASSTRDLGVIMQIKYLHHKQYCLFHLAIVCEYI